MRQHPIEKMQSAFLRAHYKKGNVISDARILARHVKPLLDALERGIRSYYPAGPNQRKASDLLAEWRKPL